MLATALFSKSTKRVTKTLSVNKQNTKKINRVQEIKSNKTTRIQNKLTTITTINKLRKMFYSTSNATTNTSETTTANTSSSSSSPPHSETTHFGFKSIPKDEKVSLVGEVFHKVASSYDLMNDVMSAGVHRIWKDHFVSTLNPMPGNKIIDVAGGTGDIAFKMVSRVTASPSYHTSSDKQTKITVFDINASMLEQGKIKQHQLGIGVNPQDNITLDWVEGDAEKLPFEDNTFDAYTIAFGIRNCTYIDQVLREANRVLKPGGRFLCLEFSKVKHPLLAQMYDLYSFNVIPWMGHFVANDYHSYQYLVESIRQFPDQDTFKQMIIDAGFKYVSYENLTFGVTAIHSGFKKPAASSQTSKSTTTNSSSS